MWRRVVFTIALGAALPALWGAAVATADPVRVFHVLYTGSGQIVSQIRSQTSPQCGEVTEVRNETTHFSWVTNYILALRIDRGSFQKDTDTRISAASPLTSNASAVTLHDSGCQSGIASCKGESEPQPQQRALLEVSGASRGGRSRFEVGAVGGFLGFVAKGFSGGWGFSSGSCASFFNRRQLLIPEFAVPGQLIAKFPVRFDTLASLRRGHYFRVLISPGHYAPRHRHSCFAAGGCLKDAFSWRGDVKVTRVH